jgi:hypothetical protein
MRALLPLVMALTACRREVSIVRDDAGPIKPRSLLDRYPIHARIESTRKTRGAVGVSTFAYRSDWKKIVDVVPTWHRTQSGSEEVITRYRLLPDGLVRDATITNGEVSAIAPAVLELPADTTPGRKWSNRHSADDAKYTRTCEILPLGTCTDGVIVSCEVRYETGRVFTAQNQYCGGVGYVGGEATVGDASGPDIFITETDVKASD